MPKVIRTDIKRKIVEACKILPQGVVGNKFGVSRMYVNALVNGRKIKRTRGIGRSKCPITGFNL